MRATLDSLPPARLEDADPGHARRCTDVAQSGTVEERRVLVLAPLASARVDEHVQVGELRPRAFVGAAEVTLERKHDTVRRHRLSNHAKDRDTLGILPVVKNRLQQVRIGTRRNRLEEAAADNRATLAEAIEQRAGVRDHIRLVEEHALDRLVSRQERREQRTTAAADIDDLAEAPEVVRFERGG